MHKTIFPFEGAVTLFEEGRMKTLAHPFQGDLTAHGFPFGHGLKAVLPDLGSGAVCMGWHEEIAES